MEKPININNIRVIQKYLDFKFSDELLQNIIIYDFSFLLHFHGHKKPSRGLSHHIYFTEFPLSYFL